MKADWLKNKTTSKADDEKKRNSRISIKNQAIENLYDLALGQQKKPKKSRQR